MLEPPKAAASPSESSYGLMTASTVEHDPGRATVGTAELADWMAKIQESLDHISASIVSQATTMEHLQSSVNQIAVRRKGAGQKFSAQRQTTPPSPIDEPASLPGAATLSRMEEICEESEEGPASDFNPRPDQNIRKRLKRSETRRSQKSVNSEAIEAFLADLDPKSSQYDMMHQLEEHNAQRILHRKLGDHQGPTDSSVSDGSSWPIKKAAAIAARATGQDKESMLSRVRRVSMDELRNNYDAVLVSTPKHPNSIWESGDASALNRVAWFLLCALGILPFGQGRPWQLLSWFSCAIAPASAAAVLASKSLDSGADVSVVAALCSFVACVTAASSGLKLAGIDALLGPRERSLDRYAQEAGILKDWWKVSRRRGCEVGLFVVAMLVSKGLFNILATGDVFLSVDDSNRYTGYLFWILAFYFASLCYAHLHICCGLELAVDGFSLRFFKEMDVEQALEEWNKVQATLRQVSRKLGNSSLLIGFCSVVCMAILAERVIQSPEIFTNPLQFLPWLGWFYPLIFLFLYTMIRAAAVTEKASRVAPLVNSWTFQVHEGENGEEDTWMDHERQYIVQYINQSEAGFYIRGVRLTTFSTQKLTYYFLAVSFAIFSRLSSTG